MCFELTDRDWAVAEGNLNEKEAEIGLLDNINSGSPEEGQKEEEGLEKFESLLPTTFPKNRKAAAKLFIIEGAIRAIAAIFSSLSATGEFNRIAFNEVVNRATDQFLMERMLDSEEVEEVGSNRGGSEG